jgi:glycosyltransferase involved in cell wall biosynthesis
MITIVHFSQDFQKNKPQLGGYSRIFNICCDDNKHIIFTINKNAADIESWSIRSNITVVSIPLNGKSFSRIQQIKYQKVIGIEIIKWLHANQIKPDLLFGHSNLVNYFILNNVKRNFPKLKLMWELNVIWGIHPVKGIIQNILNIIIAIIQKKVLHQSDHIIAQTNASKNYVVKKFKTKPDKISVIENAIQSDDAKPLTAYNIKAPYKILCFGLFDKMNGIPFLLDCLNNSIEGFEIDFYGNGTYLEEVKAKSQLGLINYMGVLPREKMILKMKTYHFVVIPRLPQIEADLFIPTKLIESMANGIIPICSDVNGMTEIVQDGINGFIFRAGSKKAFYELLDKVLSTAPLELETIRKNAINTVIQKYIWEDKHKELSTIYKLLLNQS